MITLWYASYDSSLPFKHLQVNTLVFVAVTPLCPIVFYIFLFYSYSLPNCNPFPLLPLLFMLVKCLAHTRTYLRSPSLLTAGWLIKYTRKTYSIESRVICFTIASLTSLARTGGAKEKMRWRAWRGRRGWSENMRLVAKEKMKPRQKKNPLREAHLRGLFSESNYPRGRGSCIKSIT